MDKLTGQAYFDHWKTRIAKGPHEAGSEQNADDVWAFIEPHVAELNPRKILEFGCAYGRMLRRLHARWPEAKLYGVDLCKEALESLEQNWIGEPPVLYNRNSPPRNIQVDLIFTCTVIQHVTDKSVLEGIVKGFRAILSPDGTIVMFENIAHAKGKGGAHMSELSAQEYMDLWPELDWHDIGTFMHGLEGHELMIGRKAHESGRVRTED